MHNFRLFEDVELSLDGRACVIVGINGAGKSTLLDAMCILLSCYIGGFDGLGVQRIAQSDIRHVTYKSGSFYENVSQLPVEISAVGSIANTPVARKCMKLKDSPQFSSPSAYGEMTSLAEAHQQRLREGDRSLALPLIAYYGTGRLWKRETSKKRMESRLLATFRRLSAYEDCLDAHLTDTTLAAWYERMIIKRLQRGEDTPEFAAVRQTLSDTCERLRGSRRSSSRATSTRTSSRSSTGTMAALSASPPCGSVMAIASHSTCLWISPTGCATQPQLGDAVLAETEGIVLIDEIDLHLHPQWQQLVLADLASTFPRTQFLVTTHASSAIASVEKASLSWSMATKSARPRGTSTAGTRTPSCANSWSDIKPCKDVLSAKEALGFSTEYGRERILEHFVTLQDWQYSFAKLFFF